MSEDPSMSGPYATFYQSLHHLINPPPFSNDDKALLCRNLEQLSATLIVFDASGLELSPHESLGVRLTGTRRVICSVADWYQQSQHPHLSIPREVLEIWILSSIEQFARTRLDRSRGRPLVDYAVFNGLGVLKAENEALHHSASTSATIADAYVHIAKEYLRVFATLDDAIMHRTDLATGKIARPCYSAWSAIQPELNLIDREWNYLNTTRPPPRKRPAYTGRARKKRT